LPAVLNDSRSGFVARAFDAENERGIQFVA
jgi:hypothetical protein